MRSLLLAASLCALIGCAIATHGTQSPTSIWVRSLNRSPVDVYLLCGDRDARWLGIVPENGAEAFEMPREQPYCVPGLNFFVVVQKSGWGYWVGPLRPERGAHIDLVIEKYAGLSSVRVSQGLR